MERFGWNVWRRRLLDGLKEGLAVLAATGCRTVWLNGSEGSGGNAFARFFQTDRDGTSKGIVIIDPSKESWE